MNKLLCNSIIPIISKKEPITSIKLKKNFETLIFILNRKFWIKLIKTVMKPIKKIIWPMFWLLIPYK